MMVYTKDTVCDLLGVTLDNLESQIEAGKLPYRRIGEQVVFTEKDVMTLLDNCGNNTKSGSSIGSAPLGGV
jgi:excisionase family DNA binding protein